MGGTMWRHWPVARMTRQTSKAMARERLLGEARRLFRERGYAATSLEQIAEAASVTNGAIYGHFASKEDLLISATEAAPTRAWATAMNGRPWPWAHRILLGRTIVLHRRESFTGGQVPPYRVE